MTINPSIKQNIGSQHITQSIVVIECFNASYFVDLLCDCGLPIVMLKLSVTTKSPSLTQELPELLLVICGI
jgi:hypothetical protein